MKKIFASIVVLLFTVVAACGDHVTVPADKSGKCTAGLLTKCGESCVDTQTDIANCGACGSACGGAKICVAGKCSDACPPGSTKCGDTCSNVDVDRGNCGMCGKACTGTEVCAKGKCLATCEAVGYKTCAGMTGMVDAGMAMNCVDPETDNNNCGACGNKCPGMQTCSNGVCCGPQRIGCNGQCLDPDFDNDNCGACGVKCGMGTICNFGFCSKCNNKVLILADNQTSVNTAMRTAIQKAGFDVTMVDNAYTTYMGMPAITGFGAVMMFPGSQYNSDMPTQGQQALVTAQAAGTGIVIDGFFSYNVHPMNNRLQTAKNLNLITYGSTTANNNNISAAISNPWFTGISTFFAPTYYSLFFCGQVTNGGMQFANYQAGASCPLTGQTTWPGGAFRASPNGRIVQLQYGISYSSNGSSWTQGDPNLNGWVINAIRYATSCTN